MDYCYNCKTYHDWSKDEFLISIKNKELARRRSMQRRVPVKISRNDSCPCGSGKKYKKCCLNNYLNERK